MDTTKEQTPSESVKKELDPKNACRLCVDFRVTMPLATDLADPNDAYVRVTHEVTAALSLLREHFDIRLEYQRNLGIDYTKVPLSVDDF